MFTFIAGLVEGEAPKMDRPGYQKLDQFITNPLSAQDRFYNEVLEEIHGTHFGYLGEKVFKDYLYKERKTRWETKVFSDGIKKFLEFQESDNPASSKRLIDQSDMISVDQSKIKNKLITVDQKLGEIHDKIAKEKKRLDDCYDGLNRKKHCEKQVVWHETAISFLNEALDSMEAHKAKLVSAQNKLAETFHGVQSEKPLHAVNRSKRKNKKKAEKNLHRRDNLGIRKSVKKMTKAGIYEKCFPTELLSGHIEEPCYTVEGNDLKDEKELKNIIRPIMDEKYLKLMKDRKILSSEAYNVVESVRLAKLINNKKSSGKRNNNSQSNPSTSSDVRNETDEIGNDDEVQVNDDLQESNPTAGLVEGNEPEGNISDGREDMHDDLRLNLSSDSEQNEGSAGETDGPPAKRLKTLYIPINPDELDSSRDPDLEDDPFDLMEIIEQDED